MGSTTLAPTTYRHDGSSVRAAAAAPEPGLSIGDRKSLDRANVYISADLGGAVVEHGFEVKPTARPVVDVDQNRTRRCQVTVTQKVDIPEFGANGRDVNLDNRHPRVVGKLDPAIQRQGRRPGRGLQDASDRPRDERQHLRLPLCALGLGLVTCQSAGSAVITAQTGRPIGHSGRAAAIPVDCG